MHLVTIICIALASATTLFAGADASIVLKLGRPIKVSDSYLWSTRHSDQQQILTRLPSGEVLDSVTKRTIDIIAQSSVSYVTVDGEEREKLLKIRQFTVTTDDVKQEYLHVGALVKCVFSDSGSVFTINGKPVDDSVSAVLSQAVHGEGGMKTGRILEPKKKVSVGETWNLNIKELLKTFDSRLIKVDKKNVKGTVRLVSIDSTDDDGVVAIVIAEARATRVRPAGFYGLKLGDVHMNMAFTIVAPVDSRYPFVETSSTLTMDIPARMVALNNQNIDLQIRSVRSQESKFKR